MRDGNGVDHGWSDGTRECDLFPEPLFISYTSAQEKVAC